MRASGEYLALFFEVGRVVEVLHGDEFGSAVQACGVLVFKKLVGPHGGRADVAHFAGSDDVVECFHGLFGAGAGVRAVDLEQVDVRQAQSL